MALIASTGGLIHPVCFAYSGTVLAFLWSFVYLYAAANWQTFGAAAKQPVGLTADELFCPGKKC